MSYLFNVHIDLHFVCIKKKQILSSPKNRVCLNKQRGMLFICLNLVNKFANVRAFERKRLSYEMQIAEYIVHCAIKWWKKNMKRTLPATLKINHFECNTVNKMNNRNSTRINTIVIIVTRERERYGSMHNFHTLKYFLVSVCASDCALLFDCICSDSYTKMKRKKKNRWQDYFE